MITVAELQKAFKPILTSTKGVHFSDTAKPIKTIELLEGGKCSLFKDGTTLLYGLPRTKPLIGQRGNKS